MNLPIKYRPIEFAQVVGQQVAVAIAQASLAQTPSTNYFSAGWGFWFWQDYFSQNYG